MPWKAWTLTPSQRSARSSGATSRSGRSMGCTRAKKFGSKKNGSDSRSRGLRTRCGVGSSAAAGIGPEDQGCGGRKLAPEPAPDVRRLMKMVSDTAITAPTTANASNANPIAGA